MQGIHHNSRIIDNPGVNDVMFGRGGATNNHIGNIRFRKLVEGYKRSYLAAPRNEKPRIAHEIVNIWRSLTPPGRFLCKVFEDKTSMRESSDRWIDVGDKQAKEKTAQCLRERRRPEVAPFMKKLEKLRQLTLSLQQHQKEEEDERKQEEGGSRSADKDDEQDGDKKSIQINRDEELAVAIAGLKEELEKEQQEAIAKAHRSLQQTLSLLPVPKT